MIVIYGLPTSLLRKLLRHSEPRASGTVAATGFRIILSKSINTCALLLWTYIGSSIEDPKLKINLIILKDTLDRRMRIIPRFVNFALLLGKLITFDSLAPNHRPSILQDFLDSASHNISKDNTRGKYGPYLDYSTNVYIGLR